MKLESIIFDKYNIEFNISEKVYLKTDELQSERLVSGISIRDNGITYALCLGTTESWHYGFEISRDMNILGNIQ